MRDCFFHSLAISMATGYDAAMPNKRKIEFGGQKFLNLDGKMVMVSELSLLCG